jgi:hypothetical protein
MGPAGTVGVIDDTDATESTGERSRPTPCNVELP